MPVPDPKNDLCVRKLTCISIFSNCISCTDKINFYTLLPFFNPPEAEQCEVWQMAVFEGKAIQLLMYKMQMQLNKVQPCFVSNTRQSELIFSTSLLGNGLSKSSACKSIFPLPSNLSRANKHSDF